MSRKSDYVAEARRETTQLIDALDRLRAKQYEWTALDYGTTMTDEDLIGVADGLVPSDIGAVIFDTVNAIDALLQEGHATNLYKLVL